MVEKQPKQRVSVSLSVDVYQKLVTLAAETGLSKSGLITVLINGAVSGKNDKKKEKKKHLWLGDFSQTQIFHSLV